MDKVYSVSDFIIARAGGGAILEFLEFEIPSILIPYPYATEDHQFENAKFFENDVKGSIFIQEKDLNEVKFKNILEKIINKKKYLKMKENIKRYKAITNFDEKEDFTTLIKKEIL